MADNEDDLLEGADQIDAPVTDAPDPNDTNDATPDPIADLASEMGWVPQDQFRGDPEKWRSAADFIKTGRDIQQTLSQKLKSIEQQVGRFGRVAADIAADKAAERDRYWEQKHAQAVEDGDVEAARNAVHEMRKATVATQPVGPAPEVQEWIGRNTWFNTDPLAKVRAAEISDKLHASGITDTATQLREVERAIKREFPEHFTPPAKQPPSVQTGLSRKAAPSNRARGFADMPAESQQMAKDMVRRNPSVTLEAIAKSYWNDVSKGKVG